ncbi:MAG TPA: DUF917 domain-containing protein [Cellulomonas sp.]
MTWQLTGRAVDALALGGLLLGGGGGGDTADDSGSTVPVTVADLAELDPGTRVCAVAQIGAPLIGRERVPAHELRAAVHALAHETGAPFPALVALEIGGQNAATAAAAARQTGLPLLDADLMGRALPRIDQTLLALAGGPVGPVALASPSGHVLTVREAGDEDVEGLTRALLPPLGGRAAAALYPTTVGALRSAGTAGTVRRAVDLGGALLDLRAAGASTDAGYRAGTAGTGTGIGSGTGAASGTGSGATAQVEAALGPLGLRVVARGDVRHVERTGGRVVAAVVGADGVSRLDADTEFHHCTLDGRPVAGVPDVVGVLDARTLHPVLVADLRTGTDVLVYRLPVAAPWYTDAGRALIERGRVGVPA